MIRTLTSKDKVYGIKIQDIMEESYIDRGIKVPNDEGFNTFTAFKGKDGNYYIDNFTYDFVDDKAFHKTYCKVSDGEKAMKQILDKLYKGYQEAIQEASDKLDKIYEGN